MYDGIRDTLYSALKSQLPYLGQSQAIHWLAPRFLNIHPDWRTLNWHRLTKNCGRALAHALQPAIDAQSIKTLRVDNYLLNDPLNPQPLLRWSYGDDDPDFAALDRAVEAWIKSVIRTRIQPLKVFYVPPGISRPELSTPTFRSALRIAELGVPVARFEETIVALRISSMYLAVAKLFPEQLSTWTVTHENLLGAGAPLHPEACIRVNGRPLALKTAVRAQAPQWEQFHRRMKELHQDYLVV